MSDGLPHGYSRKRQSYSRFEHQSGGLVTESGSLVSLDPAESPQSSESGRIGKPTAVPRAMTLDVIAKVTEGYAQAARNAVAAGMDGVELHCASGYLINQFLNPASNQRTDEFGGNIENRIAFPILVLRKLAEAIGADRVGFRISPGNPYNGMDPGDPAPIFSAFAKSANSIKNPADGAGLAYLHVVDMALEGLDMIAMLRENWSGPIIANNNLKANSARALLGEGHVDAISFGRAFIANPDLPHRIKQGLDLAKTDYSSLYTGEEQGYTDYPSASA